MYTGMYLSIISMSNKNCRKDVEKNVYNTKKAETHAIDSKHINT